MLFGDLKRAHVTGCPRCQKELTNMVQDFEMLEQVQQAAESRIEPELR